MVVDERCKMTMMKDAVYRMIALDGKDNDRVRRQEAAGEMKVPMD